MTGMASLVEFQDFHLNLPHNPVVMMPTIPEMQTLEEIMAQDVEPLPTPPLSPDHVCASPSSESSNDVDSTTDSMDITEALLNEMMQYEQLFADGVDDDSNVFGGSSNDQSCFSLEGNFLVQDCWWNSHTYQPRNTINIGAGGLYTPTSMPHDAINMGILGLYTPASTPPPQTEEEQDQAEIDDEALTPKNDTSSESSSGDQTDCISPTDVFPTCLLTPKEEEEEEEEEDTAKKTKQQPTRHTRQERTRRAMEREQRSGQRERRTTITTRRSSANTSSNARIQPQASASSESEEEIDVVTVSDRPERTVTRGSSRRRSGSASAPCSRQGSPAPASSRTKKRRHHVKRLRRLSSAGNEDITESDDEQRRASHNILERKRRNDLKYSFQLLREQVPELEENQRAPKVIILRKAAEFIREIHMREERLEQEYEREKKREAQLLQRLAYLKTIPTAGLLGETVN